MKLFFRIWKLMLFYFSLFTMQDICLKVSLNYALCVEYLFERFKILAEKLKKIFSIENVMRSEILKII